MGEMGIHADAFCREYGFITLRNGKEISLVLEECYPLRYATDGKALTKSEVDFVANYLSGIFGYQFKYDRRSFIARPESMELIPGSHQPELNVER